MKKRILCILLFVILLLTGCNIDNVLETEKETTVDVLSETVLPDSIVVSLRDSIKEEATTEEQALFDAAYDKWYHTDTEEAINELTSFIDKYPNSGLADDAMYYLGKCYVDAYTPKPEEGIKYFSKVITDYPNGSSVPSAYYAIAHTYNFELKNVDKACLYYAACVENATVDNNWIVEKSIEELKANTDVEIIVKETEKQTTDSFTAETETSDEMYADLLVKYGDIFINELSVFSNQKISQLVKDNASVGELTEEITSSLSEVETAEEHLQNYYNQFDSNRKELPMGTPIMTLLSHAQSALRQYAIALQHLQDYFSDPKQDYIDDFVEYTAKATDSLDKFNTLLISEKAALGLE